APPARVHARRDRRPARSATGDGQLTPAPRTRRARCATRRGRPMKWDAPAPKEREAGERSWDVVRSAWESRTAHPRRRGHRGALIAIAAGLAVIAAILSPPGMAVLSSIRDAVRGEKNAKSALFSLPSPGKVLVVSQRGAWIASADGSR